MPKRGTWFWSLPLGWVSSSPCGAGDNPGAGEVRDRALAAAALKLIPALWPFCKPNSLKSNRVIVLRVVESAFF